MSELVRAVHDALNRTAVARRPDPGLLPPRAERSSYLLPEGRVPDVALGEVMLRRRSRYSFGAHQPTPEELAGLLLLGVGTAPRAGGLLSVIPHLVVRGAGELAPGVHRADLRRPLPALSAIRSGDPTAYVAASIDQPPFATRVPVWVALAVDLGPTLVRYPPRHYRTLHLDAGAALQNLLLVATALGLSACPVMGYDDVAWEELLDLAPGMFVAGVIAVGPVV